MDLPGHYVVIEQSQLYQMAHADLSWHAKNEFEEGYEDSESFSSAVSRMFLGNEETCYPKCIKSCRGEDNGRYYRFANEDAFDEFRANCQQKMSLFGLANNDVLLAILQLLNPIELSTCRRSARFLNQTIHSFSDRQELRTAPLDLFVRKTITYKYRIGKLVSPTILSHPISDIPDDALKYFKKRPIARLHVYRIRFSITSCVKFIDFLWNMCGQVDECILDSCSFLSFDKAFPGTMPVDHYVFFVINQISARTIRFCNSKNAFTLSTLILNEFVSCLHSTERVFFSNTELYLIGLNIQQTLAHVSSDSVTFEWRHPGLLPLPPVDELGEELNIMHWIHRMEATEILPPSEGYDLKAIVRIPFEQQAEFKEAFIEVQMNITDFAIALSVVKYK